MRCKLLSTILVMLTMLTLLSFISAEINTLGIYKLNNCVELKQICANCTFINITSILYPNSSLAVSDVAMTKKGADFNYTFCNTSLYGRYIYNTLGDPDGELAIAPITFEITNTGENFTGQISSVYILAVIFLVILILAISFIITKLPSSDAMDQQGYILQINWLKYLRPVLWITIWAIGLAILFLISNISLAYIPNSMVGDLFFALYKIAFWMSIVMLPVYIMWIFYRAFQDREMKKLIERGVQIKSTP